MLFNPVQNTASMPNKMIKRLLLLILFTVNVIAADHTALPIGFCLIPEMDFIPEVDGWTPCKPDEFQAQIQVVTALWKEQSDWVHKRITPDVVKELSKWAKPQMEGHRLVPVMQGVKLTALTVDPKHHKIVYSGTLETLPSHSPVVTRWLKLYLLCDEETGNILRVTITIRGEAQE